MTEFREITTGLQFPEGPIAMPDGSVILVEIERQTLTRVHPDGRQEVIANTGGGPNGAALGPDGKVYICNNGGFNWGSDDGVRHPTAPADDYTTGRIERVDLETGAVEVLYTECDGRPLCGPNDIVFDAKGNFWFTDLGKSRDFDMDRGAVYYARSDGSLIKRTAAPLMTPNGIGLSPDEKTLYVAQSDPENPIWMAFPVKQDKTLEKGKVLFDGKKYMQEFPGLPDGLAVAKDGTIFGSGPGGIYVISPQGKLLGRLITGGRTSNCTFGPDGKTLYITADSFLCRVKLK